MTIMDGTLYIAVFHLRRRQSIIVGKLDKFDFRAGMYFYVGSAQRNLSARIERHGRKEKPLCWHIDYLSIKAKMLGVILIPGDRERECTLARELAGIYELAVPGFGSSDCRCGGHLFYVSDERW
ncbi:MAG: GIY-YIG nuclease family protein [Sedimentisphaerales bacterium]|nr:GIY-YIG nuclease family protein [Sedimentisphaerales bacterium]